MAGSASGAPQRKPHAAAHKAKPAEFTEPGTTTVANGLSVPLLANKAWVLMDFNTGQILASSNPDEPLQPASLTKMMTSYLVEQGLKSGKPGLFTEMLMTGIAQGDDEAKRRLRDFLERKAGKVIRS